MTIDPVKLAEAKSQLKIQSELLQGLYSKLAYVYDKTKNYEVTQIYELQSYVTRIQSWQEKAESIAANITELNVSVPDAERISITTSFNKFIDKIVEIEALSARLAQQKTTETNTTEPSSVNNTSSTITHRFHKLNIPTFDGKVENWNNYFSMFISGVHNDASLDNVQKLLHLRATLCDDALAVISGYPIDSDSYPLALEAVKKRFSHPRILASMYLSKILNFKQISNASPSNLKDLINVFEVSFNAIHALKLNDNLDFIKLELTLRALDPGTRRGFENQLAGGQIPTYADLIAFLNKRLITSEVIETSTAPRARTSKPVSRMFLASTSDEQRATTTSTVNSNSKKCPLCNGIHYLGNCSKYIALSVPERYEVLKKHSRCFSCLAKHLRQNCPSRRVCITCASSNHHSSLHTNPAAVAHNANVPEATPIEQRSSTMLINRLQEPSRKNSIQFNSNNKVVLLGTLRAKVYDSQGNVHTIRAVMDCGSQASAITYSFARKLNLSIKPSVTLISGIGQTTTQPVGTTHCKIGSLNNSHEIVINPLVLHKISNRLPSIEIPINLRHQYFQLELADSAFYSPAPVDLLLGADIFSSVLSDGAPMKFPGSPSAINTIFGWVIIGSFKMNLNASGPYHMLLGTSDIDFEIRKFWEIEEVSPHLPSDPAEDYVEQHFRDTHSRDIDGRYSVSLPFKSNILPIGVNTTAAKRCLYNLEKKLSHDSGKSIEYHNFMSEYLSLGHMSVADYRADYIIPHHIVYKHDSSSTKLRVVFNASSPDINGTSLNDLLFVGPKLQSDLSHILLKFRSFPVALSADIQKMYRQILVHPQHRKFQHIIWRPESSEEVREYQLNTVTYGMAPSSFLAIRVLQQLVSDHGHQFPDAARLLSKHTYVDDIICGAADVPRAIDLRKQLINLLLKGCFSLRKWTSSHPDAISDLPQDHLDSKLNFSDENHTIKILGLSWDPICDSFLFRIIPFEGRISKRSILSYIARVFDPLGFVSPLVISMKIILQELWLLSIDWDQEVPPVLASRWSNLTNRINDITNIKIPRYIVDSSLNDVSLVGFCDASEKAFAAVLYIVCHHPHGAKSMLLKAKTKVSPLKTLTISRLELCSALLLAKLCKSVQSFTEIVAVKRTYLFMDSRVALSWINTPPHRLNNFVANRVIIIVDNTPNAIWAHISSLLNPADIASRGVTPEQLMSPRFMRNWFHGPRFLTQGIDTWPPPFSVTNEEINSLPDIKSASICLAVEIAEVNPLFDSFQRFSSYNKLLRSFGFVLRFTHNARSTAQMKLSGPLSSVELENALNLVVLITQQHYFPDDFLKLRNSQQPSYRLSSLSPFLDPSGIIRVGGRIAHSSLHYQAKHPILLPKQAHISILICRHFHNVALHSGPNTTQSFIRPYFWILSLRGLLRKQIRQCKICCRFNQSAFQPIMGDLPPTRVNPSRAFTHIGVDFAGPFQVRTSKIRKAAITKGYLCLFVCFATKSVHLEFASELSTPCFMAALDRFIARRGLPTEIISDCGRNFVGASRKMNETYQFLKSNHQDIVDFFTLRHINWRFNPPYSPHFGGIWEAGVKSAKLLLTRIIGNSIYTFEEYSTIFSRIEAVLNSRPLCPLSEDPHEGANYLSPGHFLVGAPLIAAPELILPENESLKSRWLRLNQIVQLFWRRWSREYVNTLMQRFKWAQSGRSPCEGDVVYVKTPNVPPLQWPLARITKLIYGGDGHPRVAEIKTASSTLIRAVTGLIPLRDEDN